MGAKVDRPRRHMEAEDDWWISGCEGEGKGKRKSELGCTC